MGFSCGIVGMPNVGKSTLFNAITNTANAQAANYPFCTIEPNKASIGVPDERLDILGKIANSQQSIATTIDVVDIAGLIKNASKGEGLGNQFLEHIRSVDAIMHVVRCFEDKDILHTENSINPSRDAEIIETELLLSDISFIEKRLINLEKKNVANNATAIEERDVLRKLFDFAQSGQPLRLMSLTEKEIAIVSKLHLLTTKPMMYVANVQELTKENILLEELRVFAGKQQSTVVPICAKIESEMIDFDQADKMVIMQDMGFSDTALNSVVRNGYEILNLITFFTVGEKETRAWSLSKGKSAPNAAGVIHTDFENGFIKAETVSYNDFVDNNGYAGARNAGKLRFEGRDYIVQEGDIMHFKSNN